MMAINYNFFKKKDMKHFLRNQFLTGMTLIVVGVYLVRKDVSPIHSFLAIFGLYYYSYFIHRAYHYIPESINPHTIHHKNKNIARIINLMIECLTDMSFFAVLYLFQNLIGYQVFPNILILYYGIVYVSIHIINFSVFGNENHEKHHNEKDKKYCNYGPDPIDHIMNTNCDNNWEDMTHHLPNILVSYLICNYLYNK
tara:strand:- start:53 stop:643 length:591 start_codon:yes stop_codon:yes gene_type:complete